MARTRKHDRPALVKAICVAVASGALVKEACADHGVTAGQLREWVADDAAFSALYARAREDQAHAIAEQAIEIAHGDDALSLLRADAIESAGAEMRLAGDTDWATKVRALHSNAINRDKLRVDALKWMASKIAPRSYGEKIQQEVTGANGAPFGVVLLPSVRA